MLNKEKWLETKSAQLFVSDKNQWFHNHANEILSFNSNYKNTK